ncbi:GNAT family N-acetyltransferase [Shouchella sp. JSM 1781072]|uniref:GNAT family N-acetyltransferase n=1 Tax=Shouchella sp. JSM 1781072 TaxID=3344581 RepID=UPI0035C11874
MIKQISCTHDWNHSLSHLLVDCVNDGASINFLAPLTLKKAHDYWDSVVLSDTHSCLIAIDEGKAVGTVQLLCSEKENGRHRAEIAKLMVHSNFRGKGIASQLMNQAEQLAVSKGIHLLTLDTEKGSSANALYQHLGYTFAGSIPHFAQSALSHKIKATNFYYKQVGSL